MKIAFLAGNKAYLPEQFAYQDYFEEKGVTFDIFNHSPSKKELQGYSIIWKMMGTDFKGYNLPTVHEYQTIPIDRNPILFHGKSFLKKSFTKKPKLRIYKNEAIKDYFNFQDDVPYLYREMGVPSSFFQSSEEKKKFDFVYVGEMSKNRSFQNVLEHFSTEMRAYSLLLIGDVPSYYTGLIDSSENIHTVGKIPYENLPKYMQNCTYGLLYLPNKFPFSVQLNVKLLEYCALGLKVVTTPLSYLSDFENQYSGNFFKVDVELKDLNRVNLSSFDFKVPDVSSFEWKYLLEKSQVFEKVLSLHK